MIPRFTWGFEKRDQYFVSYSFLKNYPSLGNNYLMNLHCYNLASTSCLKKSVEPELPAALVKYILMCKIEIDTY